MVLELTLDTGLVDQARHQRINVARAAEEGLRRALSLACGTLDDHSSAAGHVPSDVDDDANNKE